MHEVFKIKSSKTNPKFQQYFTNFEKPQNFFKKPQILGFKTWNACKWRRSEAYQVKKDLKKAWESQGKRFGVSGRGLGDEKFEIMRKRSTEVSYGSHEMYLKTINKSRQMRCWGGVEPSVEQVSRKSNIDR